MAATPPPPKRIRTPPTPLHGPRYDKYEPFSPRRSSRIASRPGVNASFSGNSNASGTPNQSWSSASSSSAAIHSARNSSQIFSPPSSPVSPTKRANTKSRRPEADTLTPRKQRQVRMAVEQESDSDSKAAKSHLPTTLGVGMLPTPSKTPRKRAAPAEVIQSTARVLFPGRTAKVEDAMPSTRKSRKGKRVGLFSLDGLDEDGDDEAGKIPIYTDSKERVPNLDEGEANPFVTRSRGKNKAEEVEAKVEPQRRSRKRVEVIEEETEMEKKVKNDEGMIYVFRGRKVYRRFDNTSTAATAANSDTEADPTSFTSIIKRKIGAAAEQPFTRSSITPRLLFPNADQQREREERARQEEEEAVTDIEVPPTEEADAAHLQAEGDTAEEEMVTPVKTTFGPATPPSSSKSKKKARGKTRQIAVHIDEGAEMAVVDEANDREHAPALDHEVSKEHDEIEVPRTRTKKVSPFTAWQRTKPGVAARTASKGTKREREVDAPEAGDSGSGKRVRSGTIQQNSP